MHKEMYEDVSAAPLVHTMLVTYYPRVLNFNGYPRGYHEVFIIFAM